ncbi:hypothetical protein D3C80_1827520 [compost metagenome]
MPHRTGLDDQLRGFGNGHEVTGDFRMGDRQWASSLDLLVKQRDYRAGRPQHIAKANHGEPGLVDLRDIARVAKQHGGHLSAQRLQRHFGKTLGTAHHIGRTHCLVRRDKDKI